MRRRTKRPRMPVRWLEANISPYIVDDIGPVMPYIEGFNVQPAGAPVPPRVLIWGDDDLEYMDANESILERTVGTISFEAAVTAQPAVYITLPVVRVGLLVSEDMEDQSTAPNIDMWERESIEEHRWLWLKQFGWWEWIGTQTLANEDSIANYRCDVDIDSGVNRKLGKKDALLMYCQWGVLANGPSPVPAYDVSVRYHEMLRCLMKTK